MKLKNKKTGVIGDLAAYDADKGIFAVKAQGGDRCYYYSLAALHEVWEDYEEPKDFWFIDPETLIACGSTEPLLCDKKVAIETMKQIGNFFEAKEDAELAVRKLKAWKRLKDKGFRFKCFTRNQTGTYNLFFKGDMPYPEISDVQDDMELLFGGEE